MQEDYDVVETILRKLSFPEYYLTLDGLSEALDGNDLYNTDRPKHVPCGDTFRGHKATMKELGVGAERGDSLLIAQRQAVRDVSDLDIHSAVSYMKTIAIHKKDPGMMRTMNLPLKGVHLKNSRKPVLPQAVEIHLELKRIKGESGAIMVMGTHVRNGGPYLLNLCKGEPVSEDSWYNPGGHYSSCGKITVRGLEPANKYYARMRTDRPEGAGKWSQAVSIIVL